MTPWQQLQRKIEIKTVAWDIGEDGYISCNPNSDRSASGIKFPSLLLPSGLLKAGGLLVHGIQRRAQAASLQF